MSSRVGQVRKPRWPIVEWCDTTYDKALKKRCDRDPWYYDYLTVRSFVQSLGRSVRHENDTAATYVLDECFEAFLRKNRRIIPQYILDAMT